MVKREIIGNLLVYIFFVAIILMAILCIMGYFSDDKIFLFGVVFSSLTLLLIIGSIAYSKKPS